MVLMPKVWCLGCSLVPIQTEPHSSRQSVTKPKEDWTDEISDLNINLSDQDPTSTSHISCPPIVSESFKVMLEEAEANYRAIAGELLEMKRLHSIPQNDANVQVVGC